MVLFSCSQDTAIDEIISVDINGSITKGSYLPGSNISFYELDDKDLRQTGKDYFSIVDNAYGEYELNIDDIDDDIALAVANGYYWDEVRNQVSDGELDLVGIFEWSSELNINVLSHLESERVKYLIQNDLIGGRRSKRFGKAKKQALNEVLAAFGINQEYTLSEDFSFFSTDNKAKILLAISSVLQADRDTYEIASLLAQLRVDIKEDGTIDDEDLREEIGSRLCILDIEQIAANVHQQLGEAFPNLEEDSLVSGFLDDIKAEFSGYECDPKVNPGPNVISIGLITEAIDENCNELTFFTDLDNDGQLDDNETVINKITICDGTDGEDGSDGEDAVSIKVVTSAATDCSNGGTTFTFYLDANNNNQKDEGEVVVTETTICNGEDGSDGQNGEDAEPLGVQITDASTEDCPAGGQEITIFRDSDSDGVLDESEEILDTAVVCNGRSDLDNDGVPDDIDKCQNTPSNDIVDENGCSFNVQTEVIGKGIITSEVVVEPGIDRYPGGTSVRLLAEPVEGWQFKQWQGDLSGAENPIVVENIQNNKNITAVFERKKFEVNITIEGSGQVEQEIVQLPTSNEYDYETIIKLTAIPDQGTTFLKWIYNDEIITQNPLELKIENELNLTVFFDVDSDMDGVLDSIDNCVDFYNPDQEDYNSNGIGDSCEENFTELPLDFENSRIDYLTIIKHIRPDIPNPKDEFSTTTNIYSTNENSSEKIFQVKAYTGDTNSDCYDDGLQIFLPEPIFKTAIKFKIYTETDRYLLLNYSGPGYGVGNGIFFVEGKNEWQTITHNLVNDLSLERGVDRIQLYYNLDYTTYDEFGRVDTYVDCDRSNGNLYFDDFDMINDSDLDGVPDELDQCPNSPPIGKVNSNGCLQDGENIFLSENGITVKARPNSDVGDTAVINFQDYIVVDESVLREVIYYTNKNGTRLGSGDVSHLVTTKVTNMDNLFKGLGGFLIDSRYNGTQFDYLRDIYEKDLKSWDVSNVTSMSGAFQEAYLKSDLKYWNTLNVENMANMFNSTADFNSDLSQWEVEQVTSCSNFSINSVDWVLPKPNFSNCNSN